MAGDRRTGPLWFAGDDTNPARRTLFETQELAEGFVSGLPDWSAYPETDPRARPLPGPLVISGD